MSGLLVGLLVFSGGALLLVWDRSGSKTAALATRLATSRGELIASGRGQLLASFELAPPLWVEGRLDGYRHQLRLAGEGKTLRRFLFQKLAAAVAVPLIPILPYLAVTQRLPSPWLALLLAAGGFFVPDLALREEIKRRREQLFLELPDALSMMVLSLGAGQSLRQALELAARDCRGPLGSEIARALTLARRERTLDEREALVQVARELGEPNFARFAELLAAKESPYLDFLRAHAAQARSEQGRLLEQAADRAYLAMHAPLAPLLTALVLLVSYGFLQFLAHTI
jgi:Flp pilus assembly protein TadB